MERAHHSLADHLVHSRGRSDALIAVLLGVAAIAIAWGAYRAEVEAKHAERYYNRSDETLSSAHHADLRAEQQLMADEALFLELERERAEGDDRAVAYVRRNLASPRFLAAVRWWESRPHAGRARTPFTADNPHYENAALRRADALYGQASRYLDRAHDAEQNAIEYTLSAVVVTIALFLFGIATQIATDRIRLATLGLGTVLLALAAVRFVQLA